ncbi:hypothetical protein [Kangiella aquimarina]|uniref:Uncharacterized protein n=1 Tax=Kangiella aquimarina TaxID=261965 RepID=A0ABZ0X4A6_9GAMM|nr:hypothetical protein [Kangiella aquimarina]WQG85427.1 hypothetical protein SR900_00770 [Kangiella aquimarina]
MYDLSPLISAYYKLLTSIDWNDQILVKGLREGLNKFPSNTFLNLHPAKHKYLCGHFYSKPALQTVKSNIFSGLIFEHMVPKREYIQRPCEIAAAQNTLSIDYVKSLFDKYWRIAIITKEEDKSLKSKSMPHNWDKKDIHARYKESGIILIESPFTFD